MKLPFGLGNLRFLNWPALISMAVLMTIGVFFVYSANAFRESALLRNLYLGHAKLAVVCMAVSFLIGLTDYRKILKLSPLIYIFAALLLVAVIFVGTERMGAKRWVFGVQPSEFAKVATIMLLAYFMGRRHAQKDNWDFFFVMAIIALPVFLIFMQPDLGTAIVFAPVAISMLFISGTALKTLGILVTAGILAASITLGSIAVLAKPNSPEPLKKAANIATSFLGNYQKKRLIVFLYPDRDPLGSGWNRRQSQIAVGSGGFSGKGFLKADQNILGYLPQQVSANDFIFSVIAEEKGFVGSLFLLACYGTLLLSVIATGAAAPDEAGRLLCVGIATLIFCHVTVNIGMTVGLLPVTGLPLPFVSYGRTFMAALGIAMGLVQSVAVRSKLQKKVRTNNEY